MAYYFDERNRFVIEDYNRSKPFASFLPGIAGKKGIPMWVFYVNRGQCVSSFGIQDKDHPIMEFESAVRAYQKVRTLGFRTFIKLPDEGVFHEPFARPAEGTVQRMHIGRNELEIEEVNEGLGITVNVLYYTIPGERFPALVRKVRIKNTSDGEKKLEVLDGMPIIVPYGVNDWVLKHMLTTLKAWIEVFNLEKGVPFFKLKSSTEDVPKVEELTEGTFYVSFAKKNEKELLKPIVDPDVVFGTDSSLITPENFIESSLDEVVKKKQITTNKVPSAFSPVKAELKPGEELTLYSVIGYVPHIAILEEYAKKFTDEEYLERKYHEGNGIIDEIVEDIATSTSSKLFDEYAKQCYLDNVLRGGYPEVLKKGEKPFVYYLYLRKHGDQERDYNYFFLTPEYYSTGNGNYRDVNQNRRENVFFHPEIGSYDIKFFMNLIQADGYNPLSINGVRYHFKGDVGVLGELVDKPEELLEALREPFTPGRLLMFMEEWRINLKVPEEEFFQRLLEHSEEEIDAVHGEGFWCDHWTYNLDLIESYLSIYPENKRRLLFEEHDYTYYDNAMVVLPRAKRYVLSNGKVRQYNSLIEDPEKKALIESRKEFKHVMRANHGRGEIYRTNLAVKLLNMALIKFATLDPGIVGIEMEAGKPGWYDALNGLPGLFGSSVGESVELIRLLDFLASSFEEFGEEELLLPVEVWEFFEEEARLVKEYLNRTDNERNHWLWKKLSDLRESYREKTKLGFSGEEVKVKAGKLVENLILFRDTLRSNVERTIKENGGIMPMYFYYEPIDWELDGDGGVVIKRFEQRKMPLFLEGAVKQFKLEKNGERLRELYRRVKESELYDGKLGMYKLNAPLKDCTIEIGRARAFTPGWLENESIWLHMEYKYMLELIRNGLYDEFYSDFRNVIVAFLKPEVYGRSPLENSSFIVSSAYPDESIHGEGFVARLTGANAEFLSVWKHMFTGGRPFRVENGELVLELKPALPGWLFDEEGKVSFKFLGRIRVIYHNPGRKDTWKLDLGKAKTVLHLRDGSGVEIEGSAIRGEKARMVREGEVEAIDVYLPGE